MWRNLDNEKIENVNLNKECRVLHTLCSQFNKILNMKYIICSLFLLLTFCDKNNKKTSKEKELSLTTVTTKPILQYPKKILKKGELTIPLSPETTFYCNQIQYYEEKNTKLLITLPLSSNTINIYDLSKNKNKQIKKISIPLEGPNSVGGEIGGFYYKNKDSIFILSKFSFKAGLINLDGEILNTYQILEKYLPQHTAPNITTFSPMYYIKGKLYLSGSIPSMKINNKYNGFFISYDIKKDKTEFIDFYPNNINSGFWESYIKLFYDYSDTNKTFYLSYTNSDSIFIISPEKRSKKLLKDNDINVKEIQPFSNSHKIKANDYVERAKYSMSMPRYWGVKINNKNGYIYRFSVKKNSYSNFIKGKFPNVSVVIADDNFNILAKKTFSPPTKYQTDMCFVTDKGIYVANKEKYEDNDDFLTFDLFGIE